MKIRNLSINNFRGLSAIACDFDRSMNVIVGPNAIGKTTVLEAIRLTKALLMPRYFQEAQQVLVSLGAASPQAQLGNYVDYAALARDPSEPIKVSMTIEINAEELAYLNSATNQIGFEILRGRLARTDEQSQLAMIQFLSSPSGAAAAKSAIEEAAKILEGMTAPYALPVQLTLDSQTRHIGGSDPFGHTFIVMLERRCAPHQAIFSYFPADRAFPSGEVNVQIGSAEANNQIGSHIGQAPIKYQRLKQTIVNSVVMYGLDQSTLQADFQLVLEKLLPGKELVGVSLTPMGTLNVLIRETSTGKIFDIDSMSSGEKGLILTFMLLRRSIAAGGIALVDEPELHLNPAVCKNIIPFLNDSVVAPSDIQILLCTHSPEILSTAFDRDDCSIHHLRSHKDATKIYRRDNREVYEALRRLGTTAAESLFSRGNIFVEGEHDSAILEDGFYDIVIGYRITSLGGRGGVAKDIRTLQDGERRKELDKLTCFIFDLDRSPSGAKSSELVRVLQWDRYCLENYLINRKLLFDELIDCGVQSIESRGSFESKVVELAMGQLNDEVARQVYLTMEPENPGLRPSEIERKSLIDIADVIVARLVKIQSIFRDFEPTAWSKDFVEKCDARHAELEEQWRNEWYKHCSGKRLIDDLYREYDIRVAKLDLKRRLAKRMKAEQTEDWTLVKSKLIDALRS